MKSILIILLLAITAVAQETQVSTSFVLREQTRLGYKPHTIGLKVEGVYKINDQWAVVGYATGLKSTKVDSDTGKSGFLSLGARWAPLEYKNIHFFGEFDAILGALITDPYRKTVFHFRNAIGIKMFHGRLMIDAARLYQDILPDAAKLLKERGFDSAAFKHTTFNQLSAWDYEAYYWTQSKENAKWGIRSGFRYSSSKFVRDQTGVKGTGWIMQYEIGPYWKL